MSDFLHDFARRFAALDASKLHTLHELYSDDIQFRDPLHEIHGLAALQAYFAQLYANVSELSFTFHGYDQVQDGSGYLRWTLHYRHPRLSRGQVIAGCGQVLESQKKSAGDHAGDPKQQPRRLPVV